MENGKWIIRYYVHKKIRISNAKRLIERCCLKRCALIFNSKYNMVSNLDLRNFKNFVNLFQPKAKHYFERKAKTYLLRQPLSIIPLSILLKIPLLRRFRCTLLRFRFQSINRHNRRRFRRFRQICRNGY